jgi:hypothetical protein
MCFASEKSLRLVAMMAHGSDQQQQANGSGGGGDGDGGDHEDPYIVFGYGSLIFRVRSIYHPLGGLVTMTTANERTKPSDPSCSLN